MNEGGIEPPDCTGRVWSEEHKKLFSEQKKANHNGLINHTHF